jgi:sulfate transport system ATP-binding protein
VSIRVRNITKRFRRATGGDFTALDDVSLDIGDGELVALLGPSGSGKTTLLRIIAGLEFPDAGSIELQGHDATVSAPQHRGVGFVFQHYALFRHMSVLENITFGLSVKPKAERPPRQVAEARAHELLRLIQLDGYADRMPHQLSGGQRQRVALARALAVEPKVLLLDEPFGALDAQVRKDLRRWLRRLHDEVHITSVFVTHDQEEALEVADRVVVFNRGRIEQVGTPEEVYHRPATPFVHTFLGSVNVFHGRSSAGGGATVGDLVVRPAFERQPPADARVAVYVRPHDIAISRERDATCVIPAQVTGVALAGPVVRIDLVQTDDDRRIEAEIPHDRQAALALANGDRVFIGFSKYEVYGADPAAPADYQI